MRAQTPNHCTVDYDFYFNSICPHCLRRKPSGMFGLSTFGACCIFVWLTTSTIWASIPHSRWLHSLIGWLHWFCDPRWKKAPCAKMGLNHCSSSMYLLVQGVLSPHDSQWNLAGRKVCSDEEGSRVLLHVLTSKLPLCCCWESTTNGACTVAQAIMFHRAFMVRCEVHEKDPILA